MESKPWSGEEDKVLVEMKSSGATDEAVAGQLNRSWESVRSRRRRIMSEQKTVKEPKEVSKEKKTLSYAPVNLRAAVFDIETTSFSAGGIRNHLVCTSVLPLDDDKVTTYAIQWKDKRDDKRLLAEILHALDQFTIVIGHNLSAFDLNYLNSRAAYHGLPWDHSRIVVYDTYQASRRCSLKADRKSLAFLIDFFRLKQDKTSIYPVEWSGVDSPDRSIFDETIAKIVEHCESDVRMTREVFYALWPLDRSMTNLPVYRK